MLGLGVKKDKWFKQIKEDNELFSYIIGLKIGCNGGYNEERRTVRIMEVEENE